MTSPSIPPDSLEAGLVRTTDTGGLPVSLLEAIDASGGLWQAGDYDASPAAIVSAARARGVKALRLHARDLAFLPDLPEIEFLHLRSDGRPSLDPVASLPNLRALIVETGALRGRLDPGAFPHLEWLTLKVSGKGGRENLPALMQGHPNLRYLHLGEVPFKDLTDVARAFPSLCRLRIWGGDRLRTLGDLTPWRDTLEGIATTFVPLRSLEPLQDLTRLRFIGLSFAELPSLAEVQLLPHLRYLSLLGHIPSLTPLAAHSNLRLARLSSPADGDHTPLTTLPALAGLIGKQWLGDQQPVPFLEELPEDHALVREWRSGTQFSEGLLLP